MAVNSYLGFWSRSWSENWCLRNKNSNKRLWIWGLLYSKVETQMNLNRCSSGMKWTVKYIVTVAVKVHGVLRRRECTPPGRKDHCGFFVALTKPHCCCMHLKPASLGLEAKAQGRRNGHTGGTKWGMSPWLRWCRVSPEAHERFYSAPVPKPQVKKNWLHPYLIVVEVAINRKPVSFYFCSSNHGEFGPLPYSCSTADRPGQSSTVMFLLALGLQCVAFVIWIT